MWSGHTVPSGLCKPFSEVCLRATLRGTTWLLTPVAKVHRAILVSEITHRGHLYARNREALQLTVRDALCGRLHSAAPLDTRPKTSNRRHRRSYDHRSRVALALHRCTWCVANWWDIRSELCNQVLWNCLCKRSFFIACREGTTTRSCVM